MSLQAPVPVARITTLASDVESFFLDSPYFSTLLGATYCFYVGDIPTRNCLKQLAAAKIGKTENLLLKPSHQLRILSLGQQIGSVQVMCVTIRHKMNPQNFSFACSIFRCGGIDWVHLKVSQAATHFLLASRSQHLPSAVGIRGAMASSNSDHVKALAVVSCPA